MTVHELNQKYMTSKFDPRAKRKEAVPDGMEAYGYFDNEDKALEFVLDATSIPELEFRKHEKLVFQSTSIKGKWYACLRHRVLVGVH